MTTQVEATLINGVLKPDRPLPFPDQARLRLTVEEVEEQQNAIQAWEQLKAWIRDNPLRDLGRHLTRDELHERR